MAAALWQELVADFSHDGQWAQIGVRLFFAVLLGGIFGLQRHQVGKAAGMRTHMLVALGGALVVLVPHLAGMSSADSSRIIQGALAGIGFIGGGVILKLNAERQIVGVTTAAGIWLTATVGIATGAGCLGAAVAATGLTFIIFTVFGRIEDAISGPPH